MAINFFTKKALAETDLNSEEILLINVSWAWVYVVCMVIGFIITITTLFIL
jgi:hypothetical protein